MISVRAKTLDQESTKNRNAGVFVGEAKRRAAELAKVSGLTKSLSRARFDIYAMGTRRSPTRLIAEELSYWATLDEEMLGLVFRDRVDDDYGWILLARDRAGRFRAVNLATDLRSETYATHGLRVAMGKAITGGNAKDLGSQGDEPNVPFDILRVPMGQDPEKLHPYFKILLSDPGRAPSRAVMKELGPWLAPSDPHFVTEFQSKQFDQRLWELYLWAAFRELGFDITQPEAPDFLCQAPGIEFAVEATTVAPSQTGPLAAHPNPRTPDEMREFLSHYMPMKFGSSLTSKLNKKNAAGESYWERGASAGKPFILAIADFHKEGTEDRAASMTYTHSALWPYLYGHRVDWEVIEGELVVRAIKNPEHHYAGKKVASGFFDLPGAENVSAVLFSNAGTMAKFDRMGVLAGFAAPDHTYLRMGLRFNPDPNAVVGTTFAQNIAEGDYEEGWSDELQIFHNPNAKHPLPEDTFAGITQHWFKDGKHYAIIPEGSVLASYTMIIRAVDDAAEKRPPA